MIVYANQVMRVNIFVQKVGTAIVHRIPSFVERLMEPHTKCGHTLAVVIFGTVYTQARTNIAV